MPKKDSSIESFDNENTEEQEEEQQQQGKRNQLELMFEILKATEEPIRRTHLIYKTQINHYQLQSYLNMLLGFGMIEPVTKPFKGFLITEKGRTLLQLFNY